MDKILVLDFGSQTTQLIGRRVRDLGVYSEIVPGDSRLTGNLLKDTKGIILSGSPASVYEADAPKPDPTVYGLGLPLLGICYGLHRLMQDQGGRVTPHSKKEYGRSKVFIEEKNPLLAGAADGFVSWMSHGDTIETLAPGFKVVARSENGIPAVVRAEKKEVYGLQFHPEVTHCEFGTEILKNFAVGICGAKQEWDVEAYLRQGLAAVASQVGKEKVLLLISGGVDSSVAAVLLLRALDPDQVHLMYIDTGLMRKHESEEVAINLKALGARHINKIYARDDFLGALRGVRDPEKKREIIGDLFIKVQEREVKKLHIASAFLAQGTLYTDMIESGKGVGKKAHVIKSHHNVRSPLVEKKRQSGRIVEPLAMLYKDEVRRLGEKLRLAPSIIARHPFPGPGLAVRIIGEVTEEKLSLLKEADYIYLDELKRRGLYDKIWQAFCVLLPLRSVGVSGDMRRYGYVLALRAVVSQDGMTADVFPFAAADLLEIAALITNTIKDIGRVVYDVSSKPPATIEWE